MTTRRVTTACILMASAVCALHDARAQSSAKVASVAQCSVQGSVEMPAESPIFDDNGKAVARFSGGESQLRIVEFPNAPEGRAKVETGTGTGSFRILGATDASRIPLYTASNVSVVPGHVWIAAGRSVNFAGASNGRIRVQKRLTAPFQQTFAGFTPCSSLSLSAVVAAGYSPPGDARAYALKKPTLDLYGEPSTGVSVATTLVRAPQVDAVLFFSTEQREGWVHVEHHSDIIVRGWARSAELSALPRGETMDQVAPPLVQRSAPRLALHGQPRSVKARSEVPIRLSARNSDPVIGIIEPNTETLVVDVVAGWANVLPGSLHVMPPKEGQFWVRAVDLGVDSGRGNATRER